MAKVVVGLSGGVDSAVSAWRLCQEGHDVSALFMKNWDDEEDASGPCSAEQDLSDATLVAQRLGIPLHTVNLTQDYWNDVFASFLSALEAGYTPNPDVLCNQYIKFDAFWRHASDLGATHMAMGHYAGVAHTEAGSRLIQARDTRKDQTYFLYRIPASALPHVMFPLQNLLKTEVRALAEQHGLHNHARKDSTGICFIGERKFRQFLSQYVKNQEGSITTEDGRVLGSHQGLMFYTLGQRQGLHIGGQRFGSDAPWYVAGKSLPDNRLIVVQGKEHPALQATWVRVNELHWLAPKPQEDQVVQVRLRHGPALHEARVAWVSEDTLTLHLTNPHTTPAPGQSAVLYDGQVCLGGGIMGESDLRYGLMR